MDNFDSQIQLSLIWKSLEIFASTLVLRYVPAVAYFQIAIFMNIAIIERVDAVGKK